MCMCKSVLGRGRLCALMPMCIYVCRLGTGKLTSMCRGVARLGGCPPGGGGAGPDHPQVNFDFSA